MQNANACIPTLTIVASALFARLTVYGFVLSVMSYIASYSHPPEAWTAGRLQTVAKSKTDSEKEENLVMCARKKEQ